MSASSDNKPAAPGEDAFAFASGQQQPCADCGEMVRSGVVRCWNCGAFIDKEVEKRFMKMQQNPQGVLYSDPAMAEAEAESTATEDDDGGLDFELSSPAGGSGTFSLQIPQPSEPTEEPAEEKAEEPTAEAAGDAAGDAEEAEASTDSDAEAAEGGSVIGEAAPEAAPSKPRPTPEPEDDGLMESIMSDLQTQRSRESDTLAKFKGGVRTAGGFIIFCPYGCTIEVKDKHRGNMGKCPKCEAPFTVPVDPPKYKKPAPEKTTGQAAAKSDGFGKYRLWLENVRLHTLPPDKLKLKEDAHAKDFQPVDLALSGDDLVLVGLAGKGGLFGGGAKPAENRKTAQEAAVEGKKPSAWIEGNEPKEYDANQIGGLKVVAPLPPGAPSIFQNVAVFGKGRLIVQMPNRGTDEPLYLSLGITQYRKLAEALATQHGRDDFTEGIPAPLADETFEHTCHYTDVKIHALQDLEFYRADDDVTLLIAGYQCEQCGLTVSEDGRKKEGLGGKNGKGIAKAKCPKCEEKMGHKPLETRQELVQSAAIEAES